jgi:hypothetical protein
MNKILILFLSLFVSSLNCFAECNPNSKKVVIYMGFHGSDVELKGAESACKRGERVVTVPTEDYFREYTKQSFQVDSIQTQLERASRAATACSDKFFNSDAAALHCKILDNKTVELSHKEGALYTAFSDWQKKNPLKPTEIELKDALENLKTQNASVSSLIVSGHDGGGHFYGDLGSIQKEDIFDLAGKYPQQFANTKSVLLMGCWSTVPDQVEAWKANIPSLKVVAGFGGSAPSAVQKAGGEYIAGVLNVQDSFTGSTEKQAMERLKSIVDINAITAAVFIDPSKVCTAVPKSSYYALFAQNENDDNGKYKAGMNKYTFRTEEEIKADCLAFAGNSAFWNKLDNYISGRTEPSNTYRLTDLYDTMRHHEECFDKHLIEPGRFDPGGVLMLRFFQDVKKNFGKYFKQDIADAYDELDLAVLNGKLGPKLEDDILKMPRLTEDSLSKYTRAQTLDAISSLEKVVSDLKAKNIDLPGARRLVGLADTHLYALKCLDDTWHAYDENEKLIPPTCNPGPG